MSVNLTLLTVMGVLYACGIYLLLERSLTRVLLGLMLLANATNLLILTTGGYSDPLPQALILTSIVISFAVTAFMLGIIYRTWVLARQDEIQDDAEDLRVAETPSFDAEDDAVIPEETSEFPLPDVEPDAGGTILAGARQMPASEAAAEERPGSRTTAPNQEGGSE